MIFQPGRSAEHAFLRDEGCERFHPMGAFGPSFAVTDPGLRAKLLGARYAAAWAGILAFGFFFLWLGYYRGFDDGMRFAPPLLLAAVGLLGYRLRLRWLLRGVAPMPNIWMKRSAGEGGRRLRWWDPLLLVAGALGAIWLGDLLARLI